MYDNNQNNGDRLFESIRQGDIGAYEMLFKKYYLSMCMIARRIVEDEDVAKDLVQEIFIRLWEKRKTYDFQEMTDIFLYVSVRNKCFDYFMFIVIYYYNHKTGRNRMRGKRRIL